MTNGELYEIAGRAAAVRDYINSKKRKRDDDDPIFYASEIEALMGWEECCRKCGHPANEEDILNDE